MRTTERRTESRKKVLVHALVSGHDGFPEIKCAVRDASTLGCMLVSSQVTELSDAIAMRVEGIEQPIHGKIVWRSDRMAGVQFDWPESTSLRDAEVDWIDLDSDKVVSE